MCHRASATALRAARFILPLVAAVGAGVVLGADADRAAGEVAWHLRGEGQGTPVAAGSSVYFLTKRHEVIAVDAARGSIRWRRPTGNKGSTTVGSSLIVADQLLIAGDYDLFAVNRDDGASVWRLVAADGDGPGLYLGEAARGLIFTGSLSGRIYAVDQRSGQLRWARVATDEPKTTVFEPAADQAGVFAGYTTFSAPNTGGIVAIDIETGRRRWRSAFPDHSQSAPRGFAGGLVLTDDLVIAASGDGTIFALDKADGAFRWSIPPIDAATRRQDFRALARWGSHLIAGSLSGVLASYHVQTQTERWRLPAGYNGSIGFRIVADAQLVYVPYLSGQLVAIDANTGIERWRAGDGHQRLPWAPYAAGDRVFASGSAGFFSFHRSWQP